MIRVFENIDCMEGMEKYRDLLTGRRTLAIVDPPYGIGVSNSREIGYKGFNIFTPKEWDNATPGREYFDLLFMTANQIVFGGNYFSLPPSRGFIVWDKGEGFKGRTYAECEFAWSSFDVNARIFKRDPLAMGDYHGKIHPTQKPVALYRWLLQNYAKPGDLIVDTHVGSASSLIACEIEGFEYIGFELDAEYYAAATERIKNHRKQPGLFDKKPEPVEREQLNLLEAQ